MTNEIEQSDSCRDINNLSFYTQKRVRKRETKRRNVANERSEPAAVAASECLYQAVPYGYHIEHLSKLLGILYNV